MQQDVHGVGAQPGGESDPGERQHREQPGTRAGTCQLSVDGPELRLLVRGSEKAGEDEIADNPRAASVRLRAAERIRGMS